MVRGTAVLVSAALLAVTSHAKINSLAEFFEAEAKAALLARDGVINWESLSDIDWERVFHALTEQGAITDHEKAIDIGSLFANNSEVSGDRRRLQSWDRQSALDAHNKGRTDTAEGGAEDKRGSKWPRAANLNRLLWDDELARVAQNYANKCVWGHNGNRNREFNKGSASFETGYGSLWLGENIAMGYSSPYSAIWNGWYLEHNDGYWTTGSSCSGCGVIGHYTQMVWADTRYVGCGLARCSNRDYLVCNYYPGGNYGGQYAYKTGNPCTQCDADRNSRDCGDKQCGGCPNPAYASCSDYYSNCRDLEKWCPSSCSSSSTDNLCTGCRNTCKTGDCPIDSVYQGRCSYNV